MEEKISVVLTVGCSTKELEKPIKRQLLTLSVDESAKISYDKLQELTKRGFGKDLQTAVSEAILKVAEIKLGA